MWIVKLPYDRLRRRWKLNNSVGSMGCSYNANNLPSHTHFSYVGNRESWVKQLAMGAVAVT